MSEPRYRREYVPLYMLEAFIRAANWELTSQRVRDALRTHPGSRLAVLEQLLAAQRLPVEVWESEGGAQ